MPFYQNPFTADFEGNWLLGDRQHIPKYVVKGNRGRTDELVTVHAEGPYDLSGNDADSNAKNVLSIEYWYAHIVKSFFSKNDKSKSI